uniref:Uncharacterized protein n=1 Tax=uncultured Thiotrichaceae bacterium TaxID=298394 RepID=A0A6S6SV25_9GAMM|nr:MAG: Unknown protein [uncultured Thiotrichaceae bacterium]
MMKWFMSLSKHLRIAIILAPFMAIFGWGLADTWMRKDIEEIKQTVAVKEMVVTDQCILKPGQCKLSKDEMEVSLEVAEPSAADLFRLNLASTQHIRALKVSIVQSGEETKLIAQPTKVTDRWYVEFPREQLKSSSFTLRFAIAQTKRVYLAEFPAKL